MSVCDGCPGMMMSFYTCTVTKKSIFKLGIGDCGPNSCPNADALKKIAEDPEHYKLVAVPVDAEVIRKDARNYYTDRQAVRCRIEWYEDKEGE